MNLYKIKLHRKNSDSLRLWAMHSYYYVEGDTIEQAIEEAKRMNPEWDVASQEDSKDPDIETVVEGISW